MDILIKNIKGLAQVRDQPTTVRAGPDMAQMPVISNAYLMIKDGLIADYGRMEDLPVISAHNTLDASGEFVFPGFVDSHTHLVSPPAGRMNL